MDEFPPSLLTSFGPFALLFALAALREAFAAARTIAIEALRGGDFDDEQPRRLTKTTSDLRVAYGTHEKRSA